MIRITGSKSYSAGLVFNKNDIFFEKWFQITCAIDYIIFCVYGAFIIFCINWGFSVIWDSKDCIPGDVNKALPVADPVELFVPVVPVDVEFGAPMKREKFVWLFPFLEQVYLVTIFSYVTKRNFQVTDPGSARERILYILFFLNKLYFLKLYM